MKLKALIVLALFAYGLNAVSSGAGNILMLSAFVLWFVKGDGLTELTNAWNRFVKWLPA